MTPSFTKHPRGMRAALGVLAAFVALAAPAAWADPPTRAARLSYVSGDVALAPAGLPDEWGEAFVNRPLTVGDRLWTDPGSRAEIRLGSTALRVDGGTSLDILDLDDRMLQVSLEQGRAQLRTRGGPGGDAEIDTPAAAIVLDGPADARVDVDGGSGRTTVLVRAGYANVYTPSSSFRLAAGESVRIDAGGDYYAVGRAPPRDAFEQFAYARDRSWREPRYVSAAMTGYEDLDAYGSWQPTREYGNVWFPRTVGPGWAPYRDGRWVWVEPWGWSWVDDAPWGFAPFHYGRWVQVGPRWGWWPGERVAAPVYAPALVAFFGGDDFAVSLSLGGGGAVGWFPLGYRDPYIPWYSTSPDYRRRVNVAYVRDPVVLNQVVNVNVTNINVTNVRYAYREAPAAVTVVPRNVFVAAQPVRNAAVAVRPTQVAGTQVIVGSAPAAPERASLVGRPGRADRAPRAGRADKPVVAVNVPAAAPPRFEQRQAEATRSGGKPFEVKPLAAQDRSRDATRDASAGPGTRPAATATAPAEREVRVIKPAPQVSREARDRGKGDERRAGDAGNAQGPAGQQRAAPVDATPPRAAPPAQARPATPDRDASPSADARPAGPRPAPQAREQRATPSVPALPAPAADTAQARRPASPPQGPRDADRARDGDRDDRTSKAPAAPPPQTRPRQADRDPQAQPSRVAPVPQAPRDAQDQAQAKGKGRGNDRGGDDRDDRDDRVNAERRGKSGG